MVACAYCYWIDNVHGEKWLVCISTFHFIFRLYLWRGVIIVLISFGFHLVYLSHQKTKNKKQKIVYVESLQSLPISIFIYKTCRKKLIHILRSYKYFHSIWVALFRSVQNQPKSFIYLFIYFYTHFDPWYFTDYRPISFAMFSYIPKTIFLHKRINCQLFFHIKICMKITRKTTQ